MAGSLPLALKILAPTWKSVVVHTVQSLALSFDHTIIHNILVVHNIMANDLPTLLAIQRIRHAEISIIRGILHNHVSLSRCIIT